MQYYKAAFLGQERSRKAQMKLFDYTGFAMLTYTIKQTNTGFEPVGEEMFIGKLAKGEELILLICDSEGYAKAQSKPLPTKQGEEILKTVINDGIPEFKGTIKTVS
ncbi:MAG: hypothetical protein M3297_14370 [Thermoproteota archaeon]|jgi:hypothetical protein|nr:hypothetical protein [Thermoproteota archaeon]